MLLTLPPCNDVEFTDAANAITAIVAHIPLEKLKALGEIANDPDRLARALKYLPLA